MQIKVDQSDGTFLVQYKPSTEGEKFHPPRHFEDQSNLDKHMEYLRAEKVICDCFCCTGTSFHLVDLEYFRILRSGSPEELGPYCQLKWPDFDISDNGMIKHRGKMVARLMPDEPLIAIE